jgi:hypothetical protein
VIDSVQVCLDLDNISHQEYMFILLGHSYRNHHRI